jgi:hypothetical protein
MDTKTNDDTITVQDAIKCLSEYDFQKSKAQIDDYLSRGFNIKIIDLKPKQIIEKSVFLRVINF